MINKMKKTILAAAFFIITAAFVTPAVAQIETRVGPMLAFASGDIDETGIGVVAEFGIAQKWSLAPQFILYFPGNNVDFFELNANAHYYFFNQDVFELYGLGGLNFARVSFDNPFNDNRQSNTELGLNLGIGTNFQIGKTFVPFAELRFTIGDYDQFVLGAGVKFNIGK
jgi:outer membrane immunogenic protein